MVELISTIISLEINKYTDPVNDVFWEVNGFDEYGTFFELEEFDNCQDAFEYVADINVKNIRFRKESRSSDRRNASFPIWP